MNPVLILTYNNLELTQRCVESVQAQDIETRILIVDNGSTDGTREWLQESDSFIDAIPFPENRGVSYGWNVGLETVFTGSVRRREVNSSFPVAEHCLVINNDVVLPRWFYQSLLEYEAPFVTGVAIDTTPQNLPQFGALTPHPDFSAFLIRLSCWHRVGAFNEEMVNYCSDCDYHIRAHRIGVPLMKAPVEYFHVNSQTLRRASPDIKARINSRANADREIFKAKYQCLPGTPAYDAIFKESHGETEA